MVYYPSLPLITKSDQQRQQLCSPLNGETQIYQLPPQQTTQLHLMQQASTYNGQTASNGSPIAGATLLMPPNQNFIKLETLQSSSLSSSVSLSRLDQSGGNNNNVATTTNGNSNSNNKNSNRQNSSTIKPQFKCDQCNMIFGSKSAHTSHIKSHKKDNNYSTSAELSPNKNNTLAAAATAATATVTSNHQTVMLTNTQNSSIVASNGGSATDPYQCNVCQKTFAVPARLIRHYRTHTGERPFECEFCHKMFSVKENLQVHRRIHTKERPYKCDVCGRAFEHSGKLHRHMRIHTGERPHKCSVCNKTFIQSGQLVIHMRTHTGEKPYKCPVEGCGKGFTCSKQLKVHSRTHTGEKPYHCDICFRDFGYNHVLKLHKVQHYGSKCYKCTICDETFKSKKEMEAHIKGHANEIPDDDDIDLEHQQQQNSLSEQQVFQQNSPQHNEQNNETLHRFNRNIRESSLIPETEKNSRDTIAVTIIRKSPSPSTTSQNYHQHHAHQHSGSSSPPIIYENQINNTTAGSNISIAMDEEQKVNYISLNKTERNTNDDHISLENENLNHSGHLYNRMYQQQRFDQSTFVQKTTHPTINPALLAAASIASRRVEEASNNLRMGMTSPPPTSISNESAENSNETINEYYKLRRREQQNDGDIDDHINQPIDIYSPDEQYRYESLIRQRTYFAPAPVAEFKPSLRHNEIVRQVEAAIAGAGLSPPRSTSTESPERSSSPESDTMMMADRDVMTLPLRKRKLYLNDNQSSKDVPQVRMSSVIQFAKAS